MKLVSRKNYSNNEGNRFDIDSNNIEYIKKLRKLKSKKWSKFLKLKSKKLAIFKKLSKSKTLSKFIFKKLDWVF